MANNSKKWFINQLTDAIKSAGRQRLKLNSATISYLLAIASFADKEGNAWPLAKQISSVCGLSDKHHKVYDDILKLKKILTVQRRYDRRNSMTRKFFKIHLDAVLNISIEENGEVKIGKIELKNDRSNIEPLSPSENDQLSTYESRSIYNYPKSNYPTKPNQKHVQADRLDVSGDDKILDIPVDYYFEEFWQAYPRKEKKKDAHSIWVKKRLDGMASEIVQDVRLRQVNHLPWLEGRSFIPIPTTYLNGERWNDDIIDKGTLQGKKNGTAKNYQGNIEEHPTVKAQREYLAALKR